MKNSDIKPEFDAIETLCTMSASQPSLQESTGFILESEIVEEQQTVNTELIFCIKCNRRFKTAAQLKHHLVSHHLTIRPFKCNNCNACFTQVAHLKAHQRIHSGERPFYCQECGSSFIQLSHLKTHQKLHTGEKPFVCDICDSRFRQQSNLRSHRLIHTGERPFKCDVCSASFVQVGHLKSHKRIHSNERPYECKECSAAFRQVSNLRNHERTHQNKKLKMIRSYKINKNEQIKQSKGNDTFACTKCNYTSSGREQVLAHFCVSHPDLVEQPVKLIEKDSIVFMCSDCGACFHTSDGIKDHMKLHAGSKLYSCMNCNFTFLTSLELMNHTKLHHSDTQDSSICLANEKNFDYDNNHKIDMVESSPNESADASLVATSSCQVLFIEEGDDKLLTVCG